jgi:hypothetical protein
MRREGEASRNLWLTGKDANFGHYRIIRLSRLA